MQSTNREGILCGVIVFLMSMSVKMLVISCLVTVRIQEGVKYFNAKDKLRLTSWGVICVVKIMAVRSAGVEPLRRP